MPTFRQIANSFREMRRAGLVPAPFRPEDMVKQWQRAFEGTPDRAFAVAVGRYLESLPADRPPPYWPRCPDIARHLPAGTARNPPAAGAPWYPPTGCLMDANQWAIWRVEWEAVAGAPWDRKSWLHGAPILQTMIAGMGWDPLWPDPPPSNVTAPRVVARWMDRQP